MKALQVLAVAVLTGGSIAAAPSDSLPSPAVPDGLGVNIHFTDPRPGELEELSAAGFRWVRMDFKWDATEKARGEYDFSPYERLLAALDARKLRAVFILDYGNKLYEPDSAITTEEGRGAFARWGAAAAAHFQGRGILWEIWNEPNGGFWKPKADAEQYAAAALAVSKAIREAAPGEAVVGPATSGIDLKFLEACFKAGLLEIWTAVSVHPYRQSQPETVASDYHALRRLLARYAPKGKTVPILSGEWGYSSAWNDFDESKQGKYLAREWLVNLADQIPLSIWYDWHDDGTDPKEPEDHFGTTAFERHPGRDPVYDQKPSYLAAKALTSTLAGCTFARRLAAGGVDDYALLFTNGGELRLAVWTTSPEPHEIVLPSDPGEFGVVSHLDEKRPPLVAAEGRISVSVTDSPLYLVARSPNALLAAAPAAHPLRAALIPGPGDSLAVRVENLSEAALDGEIRFVDASGIHPVSSQAPIVFAAGEDEKTVAFPLAAQTEPGFRAGIRIESIHGALAEAPVRTYRRLPEDFLSQCEIVSDGDSKVGSQASLTPFASNVAPNGSPASTLKIAYRIDDGWKFLRVVPKRPEMRSIEGKPKGFGLWIFGDGQGLSPRLRIVDSTGQTFQPGAESIAWKGGRYVEFDLTGSSAHWGGANDSVIHYPLRWDSVFLLDNSSRKAVDGKVSIADAVLIY